MNKDLILREKLALQRTVLANQSTLLSFLRTGMYFLIAGISLNKLVEVEFGWLIEIVFIVVSITLFSVGIVNYKRHKDKILKSEIHIGNFKTEYLNAK